MALLVSLLSLVSSTLLSPLYLPPLILLLYLTTRSLYRLYFHPLSHIPGPFYTSLSSSWLLYHAYIGDQCTAVHHLHAIYGSIVRVAPNDVDISTSDALWPIYMDKGGFAKSHYYSNFDIDGHASIFSTLGLAKRAPRVKAVLPIFSMQAIREVVPTIESCAREMVDRLVRESQLGRAVNVLDITRAFALDSVTACVFQRNYNGTKEPHGQKLSASPCVDALVGLGRFYYFSHRMVLLAERLADLLTPDHAARDSIQRVDGFLEALVRDAKPEGTSYPSRLLANGTPREETVAQCKDVVFAGTDSTGNNLAILCWYLCKNPDM